jgi:uncharacterized protein YjbI with pentapeptide repeats
MRARTSCNAEFTWAEFTWAEFTWAEFTGAEFAGAALAGATLAAGDALPIANGAAAGAAIGLGCVGNAAGTS